MPIAVVDDDFTEIERGDAFKAGDVDPKLLWIRAAFVVGVDSANRAEMMLRHPRVEAVGSKFVLTLDDLEIGGS